METKLVRDCSATLIPAGDAVTLHAGTPVYVTQTLGGNVTVRTDQGLFRISSLDADALEDLDLGESSIDKKVAEGEFSDESVWQALRQCFDPEIPVNIVDLGLIYDMRVEDASSGKKRVLVQMTLTAQGCGMGPVIAEDAKARIEQIGAVESAEVQIVWDPVWSPQMISEQGRQTLGIDQ